MSRCLRLSHEELYNVYSLNLVDSSRIWFCTGSSDLVAVLTSYSYKGVKVRVMAVGRACCVQVSEAIARGTVSCIQFKPC